MIPGKMGGVVVKVMLDSGSSVSLVQQKMLSQVSGWTSVKTPQHPQLVTASGEDLLVANFIRTSIEIGELNVMYNFVVVKSIVALVILGIDFFHANALVLDFATIPINIRYAQPKNLQLNPELLPVYESARKLRAKVCAVAAIENPHVDITDECAVPMFGKGASCELPQC